MQQALRERVVRDDRLGPVRRVAGTDVAFGDGGRTASAAVAVLSFPDLEPLEEAVVCCRTRFPYVPGLLSFREVPALLAALERLRTPPDLVLCDGQGYAHPRRFGLACHFGVLTGLPAIGVAKSRLIGEHAGVPLQRGGWTPLLEAGEEIGAVLRTRSDVRPVYVSIGHRISLATSVDYVLRCAPRYRLPETTRRADRLAAERVGPKGPRLGKPRTRRNNEHPESADTDQP